MTKLTLNLNRIGDTGLAALATALGMGTLLSMCTL